MKEQLTSMSSESMDDRTKEYGEFTPLELSESTDGPSIDLEQTPFGAKLLTQQNIGGRAFVAVEMDTTQKPFGLDVMQPIRPLTEVEAKGVCARTINTLSDVYNPHTGRNAQGADDSEHAVIPD